LQFCQQSPSECHIFMLGDNFPKKNLIILIILVAIIFRILIGLAHIQVYQANFKFITKLNKKIGINDPPQYGDYEAQRHWMELTSNTPTSEWYVATPYNNLTYWRIDYLLLTAYHRWVMGVINSIYEPE